MAKKSEFQFDANKKPWEMQTCETSKAFYAFQMFRNMNVQERSLPDLALMLGYTSNRQVYTWSSSHHWKERVHAYDAYNDTQIIIARRKEEQLLLKQQSKQAAQVSRLLSRISIQCQKELETMGRDGKTKLQQMDVKDLLNMLVKAADKLPKLFEAERVAMGIHPKINIIGKIDVSNLTDEELTEIVRGQ